MADMKKIMRMAERKSLFIVEDAAQALGAKQKIADKWRMAGGVGNFGCFSFFPTKNLGAFGDAGIITTNDEKLAEKLKMFRNHGSRKKYYHEFLGVSSRLDEIQATVILTKFPHLNKWNDSRRKIAAFYNKNLCEHKKIKNSDNRGKQLSYLSSIHYPRKTPRRFKKLSRKRRRADGDSLPFAASSSTGVQIPRVTKRATSLKPNAPPRKFYLCLFIRN